MNVPISQAFELAVQHHQAGRLAEAEKLYRQILAVEPNHAGARHLLGVIAHQSEHHDVAIEWIRQAIALDPKNAAAYSNLGEAYRMAGRMDEAIASYRQAIALQPDNPKAHNNLGIAFREQGRREESVAAYHRALELDPNLKEAHNNLANVLVDQGRYAEAMVACRRALAIKPDCAETCNNLGNVHKGLGQLQEAVAAYRRAITLDPTYAGGWINLGIEMAEMSRLDEAVTAFRRALELKPDYAEAQNNLGNALKDRGQLDEAIDVYRRALKILPARAEMHSNLIYALNFHPDPKQETITEEQRRWNRQFSEPLAASMLPHTNDHDPKRRLRIGYVSPDFRDHAVAFFLAPLLETHDHQRFEIYGYSSVSQPDAVTARLRQGAGVWREVRYYSDAQLADCIRQDGIDILVDLAMHAAGNRLPAFARRPAPVQVSWLGYPGSTGLEAIGWRISDQLIDPIGTEETGSGEQVVRLPDAWCCYEPIAEFPPLNTLPAANGQGVTFGSLNQFAKTNEALLGCWAGLLRAVPNARLMMICPTGHAQERTLRQFAERGVAPERVELVPPGPWAGYIGLCERIDIALDTYPCNGMTTTCHALWMGVPTVTRVGKNPVSRAGLSLLHTLGLPELVAQSEEEYVRIAVELAGDLTRLGELRATLRARMAASPLMDAPRFARNMEAAYRAMWQRWCQQESAR